MNNKKPKISVIMPNYNCAKFLPAAIESVLDQTFSDFEFIIIDDGSSDGSWDIIQSYANRDTRIIALKNDENLRICKTLNKWISHSNWEYIARMDSDDISMPNRFLKQIQYLEENQHIWVCWSNCKFIDQKWDIWVEKKYPIDNIKHYIRYRNPILHPSVMIRKHLIDKVWWYDDQYVYAEDLDLRVRIWVLTEFHNIQENLILYRIYWKNSTLSKQRNMIENTLKVRRKAIKLWYKFSLKAWVYFIWTRIMKFLPAWLVLRIFNLIT